MSFKSNGTFDSAKTEGEIIQLVKDGVDINCKCRRYDDHKTPLRFSIKDQNTEKCIWLLKHGATPTYKDLYHALWNSLYSITVILVDHGLDVNYCHGIYPTFLEIAAALGACDIYDFLRSREAETTYMCLYYAASDGHIDIIDRLLNDGVKLFEGSLESPLIAACDYRNDRNTYEIIYPESTDIIDRLIMYGIPINGTDCEGATALMIAVKNGLINIVKRLLDFGADKTLLDYHGQDVKHYFNISQPKNPEILSLIET